LPEKQHLFRIALLHRLPKRHTPYEQLPHPLLVGKRDGSVGRDDLDVVTFFDQGRKKLIRQDFDAADEGPKEIRYYDNAHVDDP
jgi:hypothetical protein